MSAKIIDGKAFAAKIREQVAGYGHLPVCMAKTQYSFTTIRTVGVRLWAILCRCVKCGSARAPDLLLSSAVRL